MKFGPISTICVQSIDIGPYNRITTNNLRRKIMSKTNTRNARYTKEFKESILERLDYPSNESVSSLSEELNISKSTIYQWVRTNNKKQKNNSIILKSKNNWTSQDKFHIVLETATHSESELAEYCRRKGIYVEEIKAWKNQCLNANTAHSEDSTKLKDNLIEEQKRNKELQKELRRKEKALAETAALLVLRKKAQAIWGDNEDE